jgi:hypothetical protein
MASKVMGLSARSPVEAKSALIVISSRNRPLHHHLRNWIASIKAAGQGRHAVADSRGLTSSMFVAVAPQRKETAGASGTRLDGRAAG